MPATTEHQDGFSVTLEASLERLQRALRLALIQAGVQKPGPTAIGRRLGLDKSIAWKIGRIVKAEHPLQALEFLPGQQGSRIVLQAFLDASSPRDLHDELTQAFEGLERDIAHHAGDRNTAKAMARAALPDDEQPSLDENLRRDHFRTASAIWGAQARVQIKTDFLAPGNTPGSCDTAGFEGFVDLQRLRQQVTWRVARKRIANRQGVIKSTFEPLDRHSRETGGLPLLTKYCTQPFPKLSANEDQEGFLNFELEPGRVGRTGSVTCMIGTLCRGVIQLKDTTEEDNLLAGVHLRTPSELLVLDFFIHRSMAPAEEPTAGLFGQLKMGPSFPLTGKDQPLPVPFSVERLSTRPGAQALLEAPDYAATVRDAVAMAGEAMGPERWRLEDFVGYRVRLTYPPIPSFAGIHMQLRSPG